MHGMNNIKNLLFLRCCWSGVWYSSSM